ncbi:MAG: hypothetical protein AAFR96_02250 [Planctomycetota bacterium]
MPAQPTISIPRCTGRCALEGRDLEPGEPIVVVLAETADGEAFERTDFSARAWETAAPDGGGRVAMWRSTAPHPDRSADPIISADGMLDLFEQLDGTEHAGRRAFRYVLALQLMRKRKLEYAGAGEGVLLVRPRGADADAAPIEVHDPQASGELDEAALADLAEQVAALMEPVEGPAA